MQHLAWTRHGEISQDETRPWLRCERIACGDVNVDVNGDGATFAPYVVESGRVRHGDSECAFADGWQTIKRLGQTLISQSRLYVQRDVEGVWTDVSHGIPTRNVQQEYPRPGRCTAYLDFPDIQGYAQGARLQVGVEVGGNDAQTYGFRFRSPVAGTFRLEWVLEVPADLDLAWIDGPTSKTDPTPIHLGGRIGPLSVRWTRRESSRRTVTVENLGAGGRILHIILGPYTVTAQEWLIIYPDVVVTDYETAWTPETTPKDTGTFNVAVGDVLVAFGAAENENSVFDTLPAGTLAVASPGWTRVQNIDSSGECAVAVWTATVDTAQSTKYVRFVNGFSINVNWGAILYKFTGATGLGTSNIAVIGTGNPRVTLSSVAANSLIAVFAADYDPNDHTGGITAYEVDAGTLTTPLAANFYDDGTYSGVSSYYANVGNAGDKQVGWTYTAAWTIAAVEVTVAAASTLAQSAVRWRADDNDEANATWAADENASLAAVAGTKRARAQLNNTGDPAAIVPQWEWRRKPSGGAFGSWQKVR